MDEGLLGVFRDGKGSALLCHLESRGHAYLAIFAVFFIAGYPVAEWLIQWLLDSDGFVPDGVQVIILQPLEMILLRLRIAAQIAFGAMAVAIMIDLSWSGGKAIPRESASLPSGSGASGVLAVIISIVALGGLGLTYAHNVLIPFLLEYLAEDTAASGLQSTWQLQSWVGFVTGLYFSSILGFQVPVVVIVLLRADIIDRSAIEANRGLIWFVALFLGALISPPDPISMFLVGGPMLVLLELALALERVSSRRA